MDLVKLPLLLAIATGLTAARRPPPAPAPAIAVPVVPSIKVGVERWRAGDYPGAVAMWQPFAQAGDPDALFNMGQAYKLGRGVPADAAMAREDYRTAALKGHLPAQANLGIALFQVGEKPEAIKWLRTAADRGEARAQYVLGIAAFNGDGLPRSQALGYGYLLRAQASGLPQAVTALGSIAPGLSPADRTTGEAVAASLAAGTGVPVALAATMAPRLIGSGPTGPLKPLRGASASPVTLLAGGGPSAAKPVQTAVQPSAPMSAPARSVTVPALPAGAPASRPAVAAAPVPARTATGPVQVPSDAARLATLAAAGKPASPVVTKPVASAIVRPATVKTGQVDATVMAQGEGGARPSGIEPVHSGSALSSAAAPSVASDASAAKVTGSGLTTTLSAGPVPGSIASAATPPSPVATIAIPASRPVALPVSPGPAATAKPVVTAPTGKPAATVPPAKPAATALAVKPATTELTPAEMAATKALGPKPQAARPSDAGAGVARLDGPGATATSTNKLAAKLPVKPPLALRPFETVVAAPGASKATGWRVQLGAFSSRKLADTAWAEVKTTASPAKPIFAADGAVTKLQMGPFATRDAAKTACAKLTAAGRACFVTQG